MNHTEDKYGYYAEMKNIFEKSGIEVSSYEEINYGLQFYITVNSMNALIRIYQSKKSGTRHDFSQIRNEELSELLEKLINPEKQPNQDEKNTKRKAVKGTTGNSEIEELDLIGTDESGKGDYFGPLVIAGVYADPGAKKLLKAMGAADSKLLSDLKIEKLAENIMENCVYSIVVIGNSRYNELYAGIKNLNKLLAWGHARVIENLLEKVDCSYALSDQFGNPELIRNALMEKGKKISLEQRPRAEENVVVAAASILARNEYVKCMKKMSQEYGMEFLKGASSKVTDTAKDFMRAYGKEKLVNVAKLHFNITDKI